MGTIIWRARKDGLTADQVGIVIRQSGPAVQIEAVSLDRATTAPARITRKERVLHATKGRDKAKTRTHLKLDRRRSQGVTDRHRTDRHRANRGYGQP